MKTCNLEIEAFHRLLLGLFVENQARNSVCTLIFSFSLEFGDSVPVVGGAHTLDAYTSFLFLASLLATWPQPSANRVCDPDFPIVHLVECVFIEL